MSEKDNKTNEQKKDGRRRSTLSGVIKDLNGNTTGYVYLYPTSAKTQEGTK